MYVRKRDLEKEFHVSRRTTDRFVRKIREYGLTSAIREVGNRIEIEREVYKKLLRGAKKDDFSSKKRKPTECDRTAEGFFDNDCIASEEEAQEEFSHNRCESTDYLDVPDEYVRRHAHGVSPEDWSPALGSHGTVYSGISESERRTLK